MNLELIINGEYWSVVLTNEKGEYWMANTKDKVLYINNVPVDKAKYQCWIQYEGVKWTNR